MRYKFKFILLPLLLLFAVVNIQAQYPGGVSSGTARGYKVDYYNGTFTAESQFGAGTTNANPVNTGYTNKITNTEFYPIDNTYYGLEYSGVLEISTAGTYTFTLGNVDDRAWLFIDGIMLAQATFGSIVGSQTVAVNLTVGDHMIKVKSYNGGGAASTSLQISNGPSGSGITTATDVDGRFVRYDNAKLTAWYKASDLSVTTNYYSAGSDKVNSFINKAPDYSGNGNLNYSGTGGAARNNNSNLVNFNSGVQFDGDDGFNSGATIKGLSLRGATKTMFMVNNYLSNVGQASAWMFFHGDNSSSQRIGFWKSDGTGNQFAVSGSGVYNASAYTANEPKLLGGFLDQVIGAVAPSNTNPLSLRSNGNTGNTSSLYSAVDYEAGGLYISEMNNALMPEAIYYPFALSQLQERKVNTYLAVKYGITLGHDYIDTSGNTVFGLTTNTGYINRIFGIGRELLAEGLNQRQSQSQMASTGVGYNFLTVSKGSIAVSNSANTGVLTEGSYLLLGDNNGALSSQTTEIPTAFSSGAGCSVNRYGREWKVQITGTPGAVTLQAGNSIFNFPASASGITLLVDTDGDGDFTTGTPASYPASSYSNGIATFDNISLATGNVITFAWTTIAPGGVSNGLKLWSKADDPSLAAGNVAQWNDYSSNLNHLTRTASSNVIKQNNIFNYNPAILFTGADNQFLSSTNALGMNGSNTYAEFYVLKALGVSGLQWDEIITLGAADIAAGHRWENNSTTLGSANYAVFGTGTPAGSSTINLGKLAFYSNSANGTQALLRTNGTISLTTPTSAGLTLDGSKFRIGTDVMPSDGNWNTFQSPELIVYNTALSAIDIQKINTYLSVKYSIPLDNGSSNYLSSNGTIIWPTNTTYKNDIFGIGRDDCSGLIQKQSTAWVESSTNNLTIALGTLASTNQANSSSFSVNNQFFMVANDGGTLAASNTNIPSAYTAISCNPSRYTRTWKAANTGNVTGVQLVFGNSSFPIQGNWGNIQLAIDADGDGNFSTGIVTLITPTTVNSGKVTFNNVTIPDGATFTLVFTAGYPGGVSNGLSFWYDPSNGAYSDAAMTTLATNGSGFGAWRNVANPGYADIKTSYSNGGTVKYSDNKVNYNPAWVISNAAIWQDFSAQTAYSSTDMTAFMGVNMDNSADDWHRRLVLTRPIVWADWQDPGSAPLFVKNASTTGSFTINRYNTQTSLTMPGTTYKGQAVLTSMVYGANSNLNNEWANGSNASGITRSGSYTGQTFNINEINIGGSRHTSASSGGVWGNFSASLAENYTNIIVYNRALTTLERQKVESYMAIKDGVTLDQAVATNYIASDGSIVWNAATGGIYKNDITGIGRDDCSALYQKQSTSTDGADIVAMGIGSGGLAISNNENTNSISADRTFMTFAHNGNAISGKTNTNLPSGLSSCYNRLTREWQVQSTGTIGAVSMEIGKKGFFSINATTYKPILLISNTPGDYTSATVIKYSKVLNGKAYFDNVTLSSGQYFTLAYIEAAPGGVNTNMTVWFNSDYDSFSDIAQTTYATNDGDKVASMNNIKFGATFTKVEQSNAAYQPTYYKSSFNYNSGIYFPGSGQSALVSSSLVNTTDYRALSSMTSVFAGLNLGTDADFGPANVFWWTGIPGVSKKTAMERPQAFWESQPSEMTGYQRVPTLTNPEIYTYTVTANGASGGVKLLSNMKNVISGTSSATATSNISASFYIGNNGPVPAYTAGAKFYLGEFVVYSDDKSSNNYDIKRIHSYMAIKYGFTLDNASIGGSYIASNGTVIYDHTGFWNRITGIGMDDCSGLDQKQSFTQQTTGGLVKISNDPTGLASSNRENPVDFKTDKSFLVFGDDNGTLAWTDDDAIVYNTTNMVRLGRKWRVKEVGTVETVYLEVPDNSSSLSAKLPTEQQTVYLLVSNTSSFTTPVAAVEMTLNGTNWSANYNFTDGQYYTFATNTTCLAPAGITNGLTSWYKTNDKPVGALALMNDQTSNYDLSPIGTGTRNIIAASSATNFNRYLELRGNAAFEKAGLSETAITAADQGTLYGAMLGTNSARLFGLTRASHNTLQLSTAGTPAAELNSGTLVNYPSNATIGPFANVANIMNMHFSTAEFVAGRDGWDNVSLPNNAGNLVSSTTLGLRIGASFSGSTLTYGNNDFLEALSFNRQLTSFERTKVRTYLAIKYGQTLIEDYIGADNSTVYLNKPTEIYKSRIFGVARHIAGCFTQNQSNSVLPGSLITISVDGSILPENSQDSTPWNNQDKVYVIMGDNNGSLTWGTSSLPAKLANNTCAGRILRQWKVQTTNTAPALFMSVPGSSSSASTKLDAVPANTSVYMIVNDNPDFTVNANQQEYQMTLNTTNGNWELNGVTFDPNTVKYFTFVYRPLVCGLPCVPVNPATSRNILK